MNWKKTSYMWKRVCKISVIGLICSLLRPPFSRLCKVYHSVVIWWRHQMETFSALLAICAGNSSGTGEFPAQRPVARSFEVFFDLHLNKQLSKQSWGWWFETISCSLWRHCNEVHIIFTRIVYKIEMQCFILNIEHLRHDYVHPRRMARLAAQVMSLMWSSSALLIFNYRVFLGNYEQRLELGLIFPRRPCFH